MSKKTSGKQITHGGSRDLMAAVSHRLLALSRLLFAVRCRLFAAGCLLVAVSCPLFAQEHKMVQFQMALLKRGPQWTGDATKGSEQLEKAQRDYATWLLESGKAVIVGRLTDDGEIRGVYVLRAKSAEEAKEWADNSPGVKSGHLVSELHPWWSEEVMTKTTTPGTMTTAYLAFLKRGAKWTPEKTPQTEEIQKAHMANINRLAETKKLVVAGPFGDNGPLRGIFVFKVGSLEEAKALAETDPAVQSGRLALEIHPWLVPAGILP